MIRIFQLVWQTFVSFWSSACFRLVLRLLIEPYLEYSDLSSHHFFWKEEWKNRARPGFEPGTSRIRSANHTPRPTSHAHRTIHGGKILYNIIKVVNILRLARFKSINYKINNLFSQFKQFYGTLIMGVSY